MKFRFGLTQKLALAFFLFAFLILSVMGVWTYASGRVTLQNATTTGLLSTALEKQAALDAWVNDSQEILVRLASLPGIMDLATAETPALSASSLNARIVRELVHWTGSDTHFLSIDLIDPVTGKVTASTQPANEGQYKGDQPFFIQGKTGPFVQNPYTFGSPPGVMMTISAPIKTSDGRLWGVLSGQVNLAELAVIIDRRSGSLQTEEALIVNPSSYFVTQPRFMTNPAILQQQVHTQQVNLCLAHQSGSILAPDYRGVPVIAVYRWIPERDLCLIEKVDQAEAFGPVRALAQTVGLMYGLALLASVLLAFLLALWLTRPLLAIQAGVARFGRGELSTRLPESSQDELGLLAHEFNTMAAALGREQTQLHHHLERIYTLASNLICTIGFDGYLKDLNPAFESLLGFTSDEMRARPLIEFVHPDDRAATQEALDAAIEGREDMIRIENHFLAKDGASKVFLWNVTPDRENAIFYAVGHDITDRKRVEEELITALGRFQRIIDSNIIGIINSKTDGTILESNDYYLAMLGYTQADLAAGGLNWAEMTPAEFLPLDQAALKELAEKGASTPFEKQYVRRDGTRLWVLLATTMLPGPTGEIAAFVLDISAQKSLEASLASQRDELRATNALLGEELLERQRAEEEIKRLNDELEQRVRERTTQLVAANRELEAFAYSVSHDLRSPLRGIDGWSLALLEDYRDRLDEEGREYLERVRSEAKRMGRLIDDLLTLSRVTRAEMHKRPVDLTAMAQVIITRLRAVQPDRSVEAVIQPGLSASGDEALLEVALTNLIENAWKFTGKQAQARVEVGQVDQAGRHAFFVRDNGAGFDMKYAQKLFGAFQRLHKASEFPGTGVGLATVQRIIHRHGGQVWAEAEVEQGAAFFFTLEEDA